jgi:hypothetical protein
VRKALEWDRSARYASAKEMQRALEDWSKSVARMDQLLAGFVETPAEEIKPALPLGQIALKPSPRTVEPEPKRRRSGTIRMEDAPSHPGDDVPIDVDDE